MNCTDFVTVSFMFIMEFKQKNRKIAPKGRLKKNTENLVNLVKKVGRW